MAVAGAAAGPSDVTVGIVLTRVPAPVARTVRTIVQLLLAATVPAERVSEVAVKASVPQQVFESRLTPVIPAGSASVNARPTSGAAFGFVIVNVSEVDALNPILAAPNTFAIEGGATTATLADAVPPAPA
jgi:hypothetical protein